jgi:hypothetical protein
VRIVTGCEGIGPCCVGVVVVVRGVPPRVRAPIVRGVVDMVVGIWRGCVDIFMVVVVVYCVMGIVMGGATMGG